VALLFVGGQSINFRNGSAMKTFITVNKRKLCIFFEKMDMETVMSIHFTSISLESKICN
jgi:hypothetical protein